MKQLLLLLLTAIALPTTVIADEKVKSAIKSAIEETLPTALRKNNADMLLYGQLTMTCYAFKKKHITQEQKVDMLRLAFYTHEQASKDSPTIKEDSTKMLMFTLAAYPNCFPEVQRDN